MDVSNGSKPEDGECSPDGIRSRVVLSCKSSALWERQDLTGFIYVAYASSIDPCEVSAPSVIIVDALFQAPPNLGAGRSFETKHATQTIQRLFVRSDQVFKLIYYFLLYHMTSHPRILALHSALFNLKEVRKSAWWNFSVLLQAPLGL